jgi:hypothetical protein
VRSNQVAIEAVISNVSASSVLLTQVGIELVVQNWPSSPAVTDVLTTLFPLTNYQVSGGIRGLTWPVMKTPEFSTTVKTSPSFQEVRIKNAVNPRWHWTLIYNYLKDNPNDVPALYAPATDYRIMQGFFEQQSGQNASFLFLDPSGWP